MSCSHKSNETCQICGKNDMVKEEYDSGGFWYWCDRCKYEWSN